jgi:predicted MFS family arabinose efflux permease
MSINSAIQQLGLGLASMLSGFVIGHAADGTLTHYWVTGLVAVTATLLAIVLAWRVKFVA